MALNKVQQISSPDPQALSPQQQQAVLLLATGQSGRDTAKQVGVTPECVSHWRRIPAFRAALDTLRQEAVEHAKDALRDLALEAVATLRDCLREKDAALRLRAATAVLQLMGKEPFNEPVQAASYSARTGAAKFQPVEMHIAQRQRIEAAGQKLLSLLSTADGPSE